MNPNFALSYEQQNRKCESVESQAEYQPDSKLSLMKGNANLTRTHNMSHNEESTQV